MIETGWASHCMTKLMRFRNGESCRFGRIIATQFAVVGVASIATVQAAASIALLPLSCFSAIRQRRPSFNSSFYTIKWSVIVFAINLFGRPLPESERDSRIAFFSSRFYLTAHRIAKFSLIALVTLTCIEAAITAGIGLLPVVLPIFLLLRNELPAEEIIRRRALASIDSYRPFLNELLNPEAFETTTLEEINNNDGAALQLLMLRALYLYIYGSKRNERDVSLFNNEAINGNANVQGIVALRRERPLTDGEKIYIETRLRDHNNFGAIIEGEPPQMRPLIALMYRAMTGSRQQLFIYCNQILDERNGVAPAQPNEAN